MATQEYAPPDTVANPEDEQSPLDFFKSSLHGMVMEVESSGQSAFGHLQIIRDELKGKRIDLMRQSSRVEQELRLDFSDGSLISELARLQEEQIMIYHQTQWLEGYYRDRQPTID